mgnify:CR=1 FL=1
MGRWVVHHMAPCVSVENQKPPWCTVAGCGFGAMQKALKYDTFKHKHSSINSTQGDEPKINRNRSVDMKLHWLEDTK